MRIHYEENITAIIPAIGNTRNSFTLIVIPSLTAVLSATRVVDFFVEDATCRAVVAEGPRDDAWNLKTQLQITFACTIESLRFLCFYDDAGGCLTVSSIKSID